MKKEIIRREAIKLRLLNLNYKAIRRILQEYYNYRVSMKTLKRWYILFNKGDWNFKDRDKTPKKLYYKFTKEDINTVIQLRKKTGFSSYQLKVKLEEKGIFISESYIKLIIKYANLSRGNKMEGKRLKWVRFERKHPIVCGN